MLSFQLRVGKEGLLELLESTEKECLYRHKSICAAELKPNTLYGDRHLKPRKYRYL